MNPLPPSVSLSRRQWLGVAAMAGLAGVGTAWWQHRSPPADRLAAETLWALTLDAPDGGAPVVLSGFKGKPLVVNFWATWCPPCVEELPLLNGFFQRQSVRGWQVLGVAVDQPAAVRTFLQRLPLGFPVAMAGANGIDLARNLGNATGGLPFTVVLGPDGAIAHRKLGKVSPDDLKQWEQLV